MDRLLDLLLKRFVRRGTLRIATANGTVFSFGDGTGRPVAMRFRPQAAHRAAARSRIALRRSLYGRHARVEEGTIADLLDSCSAGRAAGRRIWRGRNGCCAFVPPALSNSTAARARRNVAHHYDLDGRLYSLFLDSDRQYSCGYFETPDQSLDDAQLAKKRHLAAKLLLKPAIASSTSAAAGAGLRSISRNSATARSPASRCRRSN